jgi:hypothetical protein
MPEIDLVEYRNAVDAAAITQLVLLERESRDLARWQRMRECFLPESLIRLSWYSGNAEGFVTGSIDMARRGVRAKHRIGAVLVRTAAQRAIASFGAAIDIPATLAGIEVQLSSHARFLYRVERTAAGWKIFGLDVIYVRDEIAPAIPGQPFTIQPSQLEGFRTSYRMLSYVLAAQGYAVNAELPGDDRPDLVKTVEDEVFQWANMAP